MTQTSRKIRDAFSRILLGAPKLPEPEPTYGKPRPDVGFFAGLTEEQKKKVLGYRGQENHGELQFRR